MHRVGYSPRGRGRTYCQTVLGAWPNSVAQNTGRGRGPEPLRGASSRRGTCGGCWPPVLADCTRVPAVRSVRSGTHVAQPICFMNRDPSSYRPELDSLRAVAITVVLLHHYYLGAFIRAHRVWGDSVLSCSAGYFDRRSLLKLKCLVEAGSVTVKEAPQDVLRSSVSSDRAGAPLGAGVDRAG